MSQETEEYDRAGSFMRGPTNGDRYCLAYTSSTSGTVQHVVGEIEDGNLGEYTRVTTDDGTEYSVCGFGLANRETGEVLKRSDGSTRKVGTFEYANRVVDDSDDWECPNCGSEDPHDALLVSDDEIEVDVTCETVYLTFNDDTDDPGMAFDHDEFEAIIEHYQESK